MLIILCRAGLSGLARLATAFGGEGFVFDLAAFADGDFRRLLVADAALLAVEVGGGEGRLRRVERGRVEAGVVDARVVDGRERGDDGLADARHLAQGEIALVELAVADDGVEDFVDDGADAFGVGAGERTRGGLAGVGEHHHGRLLRLRPGAGVAKLLLVDGLALGRLGLSLAEEEV